MSAWVAKLPRLCRFTGNHEAIIVYNLSLFAETHGWRFVATDAGDDDGAREELHGDTPEERAQELARLVGEVDDLKAYVKAPDGSRSWMLLINGNGQDVISDYGTNMTAIVDKFNAEAQRLLDDRSTAEVLGIALARVAELEARQTSLADCVRALVACAEPHRDRVEIKAARELLAENPAPVPG